MKLHFLASFTGADTQGGAWPVVFIDEGETTGRHWGIWKTGLEASLPKFNNVWVQGFKFEGGELNHLSDDVRAVFPSGVITGNIVGIADGAQLTTLANGKHGITGFFRPASEKLHNLLLMAQRAGKLSEFGLSINGDVTDPAHLTRRTLASGKQVDEVLQIDELYSVDMVSHPGRGGGFLNASVLAGAGFLHTPPTHSSANGDRNMKTLRHILKDYLTRHGIAFEDGSALSILASIDVEALPEADQSVIALAKLTASASGEDQKHALNALDMLAADKPPFGKNADEEEEEPEEDEDDKKTASAALKASENRALKTETQLRVRLFLEDEDGLKPETKKLIASRLDGKILTDAQITAEIEDYKALLKTEVPDEKAKPLKASGMAMGMNPADKIQQAADRMCGVRPDLLRDAISKLHQFQAYPGHKMHDTFGLQASSDVPTHYEYPAIGLRELYVSCTGDTEVSFDFGKLRKKGLLAAAINETTPFGDALSTSMNRRLLQDWMMKELKWRSIATIKPGGFTDFRAQEIIAPGGIGELATVADDGEYQEISLPTDSKESYTPLTKGNLLPITRRAVLRDDVGLVNRMITSLRRGAQHTFHKAFFYKLVGWNSAAVNDYVMADGNPIYDAINHGNLVAGAYTYNNLKAARLLMRQQTEKESGIWLDLIPKYHVIPVSFEDDGMVYIKTPQVPGDVINDVNVIQLDASDVIIVDDSLLGGSAAYGYLVADPMDYETLEVAFLMDQQVPEIFVQNDPTVGDTFKQDRFTWKIRYEFGIGIGDWRGVCRLGA